LEKLLLSMVYELVTKPEEVSVKINKNEEDDSVTYFLHVAKEDAGRVIGKQGRIANAIRIIMHASAARSNSKISIEIE